MPRPSDTYRSERRNAAKKTGMVWKRLDGERLANGMLVVHVPHVWRKTGPVERVSYPTGTHEDGRANEVGLAESFEQTREVVR